VGIAGAGCGQQSHDGFGPYWLDVGGSFGKARGNATSAERNGQDHNASGIHTLHFPQDAATLRRRVVELTSYSSKHG
jgi:hypothetical protein